MLCRILIYLSTALKTQSKYKLHWEYNNCTALLSVNTNMFSQLDPHHHSAGHPHCWEGIDGLISFQAHHFSSFCSPWVFILWFTTSTCPTPIHDGRPRKIFSLLIKRAGQMIQPAYCSSGTAAWWKNCPFCAKLSFLCSSHDHSTLPKGPGAHGLCSGASPEGSLTPAGALPWARPLRRDIGVEWIANLNCTFYCNPPLLFGILLTSRGGSSKLPNCYHEDLAGWVQEKQPLLTQLVCCQQHYMRDSGVHAAVTALIVV